MKIHPCHQKKEIACFAGNTDPPCSKCWTEVESIEFVDDKYRGEYTSQQEGKGENGKHI